VSPGCVEERLVTEHGNGHGEEAVSDAPQGAAVAVMAYQDPNDRPDCLPRN